MMELLTSPEAWAALVTLTALEIVLGIDNVIFLSVIVSRIPAAQAERARKILLALALIFRIALLSALVWLIGFTKPVIELGRFALSWRDLILIGGGLFLIAKATHEIHSEVEARDEETGHQSKATAFFWVIVQIIIIDLVFSLDSIITAIGMAQELEIMIAAVVIAVGVMYISAGPVAACGRASDHEDAGPCVPRTDRRRIGGGRIPVPHSAFVHLCGDLLLGRCRGLQHSCAAQPQKTFQNIVNALTCARSTMRLDISARLDNFARYSTGSGS